LVELGAVEQNEKLKVTASWCPQRDAPPVLVSAII
jgi:hypothetical protein